MTFDPATAPRGPAARAAARRWVAAELQCDGPWAAEGTDFDALLSEQWDRDAAPSALTGEPWMAALIRDTALHGGDQASAAMQILLDWSDGRDADPADLDLVGDLMYQRARNRLIRLAALPECAHSLDPGRCDCAPRLHPDPPAFGGYDPGRPPRDAWALQVAYWWLCRQLGIEVSQVEPDAARRGIGYIAEACGPAALSSPRDIACDPVAAHELRSLLTGDEDA